MKLRFLLGLGAGYVLGARAGRQSYDAIVDRARELMGNERVQRLRDEVVSTVESDDNAPASGLSTPPVTAGPGPKAGTTPTAPAAPATGSTPSRGAGAPAKAAPSGNDVVLPDLAPSETSASSPGTKNPAKPVTPPSTKA